MRARRLLAAAALASALAPQAARANGPDAYGFGSRGAAMAGAVGADAADFSGSYYNPAALAGAPGVELSLGYAHASNRLAIDGRDVGLPPARGLTGGVVAPGTLLGVPFALGVATFLPDDGLSHIKARRQEVPRFELYDTRSSILFLAANLAVRPLPWLEVGGGVAFLAATHGRFGIRGTADVLHPYDSKLEHEVDADLTSIRYPQAGLRLLLGDLGAVGLTFRGESKLDLSLTAKLAGSVDFAGIDVPLLYDLETHTIDAFLPQQLVVAASFQRVAHLHVNVDVTWVNWSAYESPTALTKAHLDAKPPPGTPIELPADPKPTKVIPPSFEDRFVPRIGVEYVWPAAGSWRGVAGRKEKHRAFEIPLRAGYAYEATPVPPQTGLTNFVDADRHTFTFGSGVAWNAPSAILRGSLALDAHMSLSILPERTIHKTSPADFIGDYRAEGRMIGGGATLTAAF